MPYFLRGTIIILYYIISYSIEYYNNLFNNKNENYKASRQLLISYYSGLSVSLLTMPLWTLRTRISLITLNKNEKIKARANIFYLVVKESIQKGGVLSLYKGALSSAVLSFHGGIQMTAYETGKNFIKSRRRINSKINSTPTSSNNGVTPFESSILGVISKICASTTLYPFNVIRARQQQFSSKHFSQMNNKFLSENVQLPKKEYGMFANAAIMIYQSHGARGFYKGWLPTVLRQIPGSTVFFYTYEFCLKKFNV